MKNGSSEKKDVSILLVVMLIMVAQVMSFCQNQQGAGQKQPPAGQVTPAGQKSLSQPLTPAQSATIKTILSKYTPSTLSAADARAIHEKFRDAGIHAGPESRSAIIAAGFDPEKLRTLAPPPGPGEDRGVAPPSNEEKLKIIQEKVFKPLTLNATQTEAVTRAWKEFFSGLDNLMKAQGNPREQMDRSKIEPLEKARDEKVRQAVSPAQFAKYRELEKASRPPRPDGPAPNQN